MTEAKRIKKIFAWQENFLVPDVIWYVKRLSANDTLASKAHQAGPYVPRDFLFSVFPKLHQQNARNPDVWFDLYVDSHGQHRNAKAIWYNNKFFGGTRNEARLTNLGGQSSPLLDADNTGSLVIFTFVGSGSGGVRTAHVWVCQSEVEEALIEDRVGPVEPGQWLAYSPAGDIRPSLLVPRSRTRLGCRLAATEIPEAWFEKFPTGAEIIEKSIKLCSVTGLGPDERLLTRRNCEFDVFLSLEEAVELPVIKEGFTNIDAFVSHAQSILQRRKARSGRSLEVHLREIFIEEGLRENVDFSHGVEAEPGRRPDFIFPSRSLYDNPDYPDHRLRMLAVKTTCKDRWRQILNEAGRIATKHLLTLQEGVSIGQFQEMQDSGVRLVVPTSLHSKYPAAIRSDLMTLEEFIDEIKLLGEASRDSFNGVALIIR